MLPTNRNQQFIHAKCDEKEPQRFRGAGRKCIFSAFDGIRKAKDWYAKKHKLTL